VGAAGSEGEVVDGRAVGRNCIGDVMGVKTKILGRFFEREGS
jgi:hypothetical protein